MVAVTPKKDEEGNKLTEFKAKRPGKSPTADSAKPAPVVV